MTYITPVGMLVVHVYDSVPLGKSSERVESRNPYNANLPSQERKGHMMMISQGYCKQHQNSMIKIPTHEIHSSASYINNGYVCTLVCNMYWRCFWRPHHRIEFGFYHTASNYR